MSPAILSLTLGAFAAGLYSLKKTVHITTQSNGVSTHPPKALFDYICDPSNLHNWYPFLSNQDPNTFQFDVSELGLGMRFHLQSGPHFSSSGEIVRIKEPTLIEFKIRSLTPIKCVQRVEISLSQSPSGTVITMTSREKVKLVGAILSKLVGGNSLIEEDLGKSIRRLSQELPASQTAGEMLG